MLNFQSFIVLAGLCLLAAFATAEKDELNDEENEIVKRSAEPIFFGGKGGGRGHGGGHGGGGYGGGRGGGHGGGGYGHGKRSVVDEETLNEESELVKRSAEPIFFGKGGGGGRGRHGGGHGGGYGGGRGGGFGGGHGGGHGGRGGGYGHGK